MSHRQPVMQESRVRVSSLPPFRLDLGSAAVNEQFDTRDETGVIGREKQRHLSNFLGFPMRPSGTVDTIRAIPSDSVQAHVSPMEIPQLSSVLVIDFDLPKEWLFCRSS